MNPLIWDDVLSNQMHFESEQVHVLTALYGAGVGNSSDIDEHLLIAKSIELMKASTLILDDFLDKSETRNGLPSVFSARGAEQTVLIAEIMRSTALIEFCKAANKVKHEDFVKAVCIFEEAYKTICFGQLEDIKLEASPFSFDAPTEDDYFKMIHNTSGVFIQLPLLIGAFFSGYSRSELKTFAEYGIKLGLAYQVRDDIIDIVADPNITGKPVAGDIRYGKKRLPILRLRNVCSEEERKCLFEFINGKKPLPEKHVQEIIDIIIKYRIIPSCMTTVTQLCNEALSAIKNIPDQRMHDQLIDIAMLLTDFDCIPENVRI